VVVMRLLRLFSAVNIELVIVPSRDSFQALEDIVGIQKFVQGDVVLIDHSGVLEPKFA